MYVAADDKGSLVNRFCHEVTSFDVLGGVGVKIMNVVTFSLNWYVITQMTKSVAIAYLFNSCTYFLKQISETEP